MSDLKSLDQKKILKQLDVVCYHDRNRIIAQLAHDFRGSEQLNSLLRSLLESGAYEAHLALIALAVSPNGELVLTALQHTHASVRKQAARLLPLQCGADVVERELMFVSSECRRQMLKSVLKMSMESLAERLLPEVFARWGEQEAAILLPACATATVEQWLPRIDRSVMNWRALAARHLDAVASFFQLSLERTPLRNRMQVWSDFAGAMDLLCARKAELVLRCALELGPQTHIPYPLITRYRHLIVHDVNRVYVLLTRLSSIESLVENGLPKSVLANIRRFRFEQLLGLAKILIEEDYFVAQIFTAIAPADREALFEALYPEAERGKSVFTEELMNALPHRIRDREAKRMLELREIREEPFQSLNITGLVQIESARPRLETFVKTSDADQRAQALTLLLRCSAMYREGMSATLSYLARIKNEQDPVRFRVMSELADCPAARFCDEHVPSLRVMLESVLEARDSSHSTLQAVAKFAVRLLRHHSESQHAQLFRFAIEMLGKLADHSGRILFPHDLSLSPAGEQALVEHFLPKINQQLKTESANLLFSLEQALGKRAFAYEKLQLLLQQATQLKPDHLAKQAIRLWLKDPRTRAERVRQLLKKDASVIVIDEVFLYIHQSRQDWLDPFINGTVIKGRFLSGRAIHLLPATSGFHRWLPRQQLKFAELLIRYIETSKQPIYERTEAIRSLANLPDGPSSKLLRFADSEQVEIAEATLHAVSLTEQVERAFALLLNHVDGDRARVAMYSVARCLRRIPERQFTQMLQSLLQRDSLKVTVRKEAVRLLGLFKSDAHLQLVLQEYAKNPHKDVLTAIGHAALNYLADERIWEILQSMVRDDRPDVAISIFQTHVGSVPEMHRNRFAELFITGTEHPVSYVARHAFWNIMNWSQGSEERIATVCATSLLDASDQLKWNAAADALTTLASDGGVGEQFIEVVRRLGAESEREQTVTAWNAASERDLPHRQRLYYLLSRFLELSYLTRLECISLVERIVSELEDAKTLQQLVLQLLVSIIDWREPERAYASIHNLAKRVERQPFLAATMSERIAAHFEENKAFTGHEQMLRLIDRLRADSNDRHQLVALHLLRIVGKSLEWRADCCARLREFRVHSKTDIRCLALDTFVAEE